MRAVLLFSIAAIQLVAQDAAMINKSHAAREALLAGRYTEAVSLYRELVAVMPNQPGLHLDLGLALEKAGQPSAAVPELQQVTRAEPDLPGAWFLLGLAYAQMKRPREAIAPLKESLRLDPSNPQALLELADAELTSGDPLAAAHDFAVLSDRHPDMPKAWEGLGLSYLAQSNRALARLRQHDPDSAYQDALLARARAGQGELTEALHLYAKALEKDPQLSGLHAARAALYREMDRIDLAAQEEAAETRIPKTGCAANPFACIDRQPNSSQDLYWSSLGAAVRAEQSFAHISSMPVSPEAHELAAESDQRSGRRLDAIAEWRKAVALDPANRRIQGRLAESLYRAREYEEAEHLLTALVKAQPENVDWQYLLGSDLFRQKRDVEALPYLERAARLEPDFLPAQQNLGLVYLDLDQFDKAVACLERARPLDDGSISFALSNAYRRLGRTDDARAALARFHQLRPTSDNNR